MIQAPQRRGAHAKASGSSDPVAVTLIGATEQSVPAGSDSISWVLLTNLLVKDFESATEKVQWYGKRWGIEIWHKVLSATRAAKEVYLVAQSRDDDCRPARLQVKRSRPDAQPSVAYGLWRIPWGAV
jgi:hypothetical protein